ncbi:MAG: hypothetical protein CVV44_09805 [Spirochaetae bacterium HGW-Spirochaetae-1]|nr:MAG: hypothetical protein CVV44_09805 [Spirochaetae bacterium HGW-Spirochaetae-1]
MTEKECIPSTGSKCLFLTLFPLFRIVTNHEHVCIYTGSIMPGMITHQRILIDSIKLLGARKKSTYLLRSIAALFSSDEYYRAAVFGSLGPNIFDYIPQRNRKHYYGHEISFFLHNGNSEKLIAAMLDRLYSYEDKNNEWSAEQRAYLYGFISHMIADALIHPFIFFWSGFPDSFDRKETVFYREQNLLFQYNIDNYYLYKDERRNELEPDIGKLLPVRKRALADQLRHAIKDIILEALNKSYPDIYPKIIWRDKKENESNYTGTWGYLDAVPFLIKTVYGIKTNKNIYFSNFVREIRMKKLFYSDFLVQYPQPRRLNTHVLNFHRERWNYPTEKTGLHYESIDDLLKQACEKIVTVWEKIEASLYTGQYPDITSMLADNAYTGVKNAGFDAMDIKNPSRILD